ncbi:hypothetical protein GCM10010277_17720 [Streptomyces longisporoflavus]|uniref:hypothetical protein n=1 Tax=Streptomyces longisporoflavus TaxID=28044 RepID=UPI00198E059A|nr:hypothetical protein [Streptomyces longisporoflavus]GGV32923.1 hypothetical protein GCM10010277_17720 [Streptomyces longisporoflavus]
MWYAQNPGRRTRQLLGDGAVLLWTALWTAAAVVAYRLACLLTRPAPELPAPPLGDPSRLPLVGDRVDSALRLAADFAGAGDPVTVRAAVVVGAVVVFLVPVGLVLNSWLPRRLRWVRQAAAARDLAASSDGRELLALRALLRPLDEVARTAYELPDATAGSLAEGWRGGDPEIIDALAEAELVRLGLRIPEQVYIPVQETAGQEDGTGPLEPVGSKSPVSTA